MMDEYTIPSKATVRQAMERLDAMGIGLVVVCHDDGRVEGAVSDGDVRRGLLRGATLESPVAPLVSRDYVRVPPGTPRADVLDLMQARSIKQVPIVNERGRLEGVHTLQQLLGTQTRPNWAVVMAGGYGARLHPLTEEVPKPMLKVAGRPILERIVLHLVGHGIRRVFLAVNYLAGVVRDHFGDGRNFGCAIEYIEENEPLGSGGAVSLLPAPVEAPLLVVNGDLVTDTNFAGMLDFHERGRYYATMGLKPYRVHVPYGCAEVDGDRIVTLREKPLVEQLVNAGVYVLSSEAVGDVPPERFFPMTELFEAALRNGGPCGAFVIEEDWIDVGRPGDLRRAQVGQ